MNKYRVKGLYTISFTKEVEAKSREEAEDMAYDIYIKTEWNGNSVFVDDDTELCADGEIRDVEVELIEGSEDEDDEE